MSNLLLDSLEIKNFRTFRHLRIEKLGRVNLITGKNSVGKTTLLDAIELYARRGTPRALWSLLSDREQSRGLPSRVSPIDVETQVAQLAALFWQNQLPTSNQPLSVGSSSTPQKHLTIRLDWDSPIQAENDEDQQVSLSPDVMQPKLIIQHGTNEPIMLHLQQERLPAIRLTPLTYTFVYPLGLSRQWQERLWESIALTPQEDEVLAALQLIIPDIERISFLGTSEELGEERIPFVRRAGKATPESLRSLGGGVERLFDIALALVNARDGFLLVDEIENGLHYTVQVNMWRLLFTVARRLNVQVFATTHSWDAITAFQEAAREDTEAEGYLIRLETLGEGDVIATIFDEKDLAIVTREQIEVR